LLAYLRFFDFVFAHLRSPSELHPYIPNMSCKYSREDRLAHRHQRNALVALIAGHACAPRVKDWFAVHEKLISVVTMRELHFDEPTAVFASSHGMRSRIPPTEITHQDMGFAGDHILESFEGNCIRGARFSRSGDPLF